MPAAVVAWSRFEVEIDGVGSPRFGWAVNPDHGCWGPDLGDPVHELRVTEVGRAKLGARQISAPCDDGLLG